MHLNGCPAHEILREAINTGMEYPDAEYRVASTLYMNEAERQAMADAYLTIDDTEHQLRNYWN